MNFLIRPDAEQLLREDDYRRLWAFFTHMGATAPWLTEEVRAVPRDLGPEPDRAACNYYRASPLRPPPARRRRPGAAASRCRARCWTIHMPDAGAVGDGRSALPPALLEGLDEYVPRT
jgi:hypothetical protein